MGQYKGLRTDARFEFCTGMPKGIEIGNHSKTLTLSCYPISQKGTTFTADTVNT